MYDKRLLKSFPISVGHLSESTHTRAKMALRERAVSVTQPACPPLHIYKQHPRTTAPAAAAQRGHGMKTLSDVWRPGRHRIHQCVGYSEENPYYDTQPEAARALRSIWNRPSVHETVMDTTAIKTKTATTKGTDLTTSLFTFSTVWGALVLAKHWFPQLCATTPSCAPKRVTADRATAIMWRLHKIIPKDNTGCWAADLRSRQRAIVEEVVQFKPAQIREMSQSKHRARPGNHSEEENVHRPVTTAG